MWIFLIKKKKKNIALLQKAFIDTLSRLGYFYDGWKHFLGYKISGSLPFTPIL